MKKGGRLSMKSRNFEGELWGLSGKIFIIIWVLARTAGKKGGSQFPQKKEKEYHTRNMTIRLSTEASHIDKHPKRIGESRGGQKARWCAARLSKGR